MGAGSIIVALIIGAIIGYLIGNSNSLNQILQISQTAPFTNSNTPTVQSSPTESIHGVATQISSSGNGGSATILTSSAGTETTITWTSNNGIPNPSNFLSHVCTWTLSGSTLVSVKNCSY